MTRFTGNIEQVRDMLATIRRDVRHRLRNSNESGAEGEEPADPAPATVDVDMDRIPELLAGDREEMNQAVGWLLTAPHVPEDVAAVAVEACVDRLDADQFSTARLAYRGLDAIYAHHPTLVAANVRTVAEGLAGRNVSVQNACVGLLVDLCTGLPELTPVVYPYLQAERETTRAAAFDVLLEVGEVHPIVLCSIDPYLRQQLADPTLPRTDLVEAYLRRQDRDPGTLADAIPTFVDWLPTTDRELEEAIVRAVTAFGEVPAANGERVLRTCLTYLAAGERPSRDAVARWVVHAVATDDELRSALEAWRADTDEWDRLRVAATIEEATDDGIEIVGPHLIAPSDTFAGEFGLAAEGEEGDRS